MNLRSVKILMMAMNHRMKQLIIILFLLILCAYSETYAISNNGKIPILVYHSHAVIDPSCDSYAGNDYIKLANDLESIQRKGFQIIPLKIAVEWAIGRRDGRMLPEHPIVLTFDDGYIGDYYPIHHPCAGSLPSFYQILLDFKQRYPDQRTVHATSFIVASPITREKFEKAMNCDKCMTDSWWKEAIEGGIFDIENHSMDHEWPFESIDNYQKCFYTIALSGQYIKQIAGKKTNFFASPWGVGSDYLVNDYLPNYSKEHGLIAAFIGVDNYLSRQSNRWAIPRFCGWKSKEELNLILDRSNE